MPATIRVQSLDGEWQTLGVERFTGIQPEQIRPAADQLGPSTLTFQLQRDDQILQPDLTAWTPIELDIDGITVWDGRIKETPTQSGQAIAINAIGYSSHLDDDALERGYVHQDLSAWADARGNPNADLTRWVSAPQVTSDKGQSTLQLPQGSALASPCAVGITLDLGPKQSASAIIFDATIAGYAAGTIRWIARTHNAPDALNSPTFSDTADSNVQIANGVQIDMGGTFASPQRYVTIMLWLPSGLAAPTADVSMSITRALISGGGSTDWIQAGDGAGGAQGASNLRASDVVTDVLTTICPLYTITARSPAYRDEILADAPQSYYRFNAQAAVGGLARDLGRLNNPLTVFANNPGGTTGLLIDDSDGGISLNGTNQYATAPNGTLIAGDAGTLEAIILPTALSGTREIIRVEGWLALRTNGSNLELIAWIGGGTTSWITSGITLQPNGTYHLLATYSAGAVYILINGTAAALTRIVNTGTGIGGLTAGSGIIHLGAYSFTPAEFFAGTIDEVGIYNYSLNAGQRQQHYTAARSRVYGGIQRTQFKIPHYWPTGAKTAREHLASVNALHNWRLKIPVGRRPIFQPQSAAATLRAADDIQFNDAGANDGEIIYNRCTIEGQDATGLPIRVTLNASDVLPPLYASVNCPQPTDPGFETGLSGATAATGIVAASTLAWSAAAAHNGTHSALLSGSTSSNGPNAPSAAMTLPIPGTFRAGVPYTLTIWALLTAGTNISLALQLGIGNDAPIGPAAIPAMNTWTMLQITWTPQNTYASGVTLTLRAYQTFARKTSSGPTLSLYLDDVALTIQQPTIVDRRNFTRTKILQAGSAIDTATASLLARAFLLDSATSPFRGTFIASSPTDVLMLPQNTPVAPSELLLHTGELIRIPRLNPDTGDIGRDGKIVTVTYDDDSDQATVSIDDDRNNLQALMQRMAITDQARGV